MISLSDKDNDVMIVSAKEYAKMIKNSKAYQGGAVRIISCQAGAKDDGAAQQLANELGVTVLAPTEIVNVDEEGRMFLADSDVLAEMWYNSTNKDEFKETGEWKKFKPRKG